MIQELFKAFLLIFVAEMGDKTQILAMAFATRFPVKKILAGIFLGSLLNHGLAVVLGRVIQNYIPINTVQVVAGLAFVGFALWTLKSDDDENEDDKQKSKFGPIITVALAFFLGELGDKTQLTAITLATDAKYPLAILAGTVLGMIVVGGIGIIIGKKLGDKIPEFTIKISAASVFMIFGLIKLYQTVPNRYLTASNITVFISLISILAYLVLRPSIIKRQQGQHSLLRNKSKELYDYYRNIEKNVNKICLGIDVCGDCKGRNCVVGYTKSLIKDGLEEKDTNHYVRFNEKSKSLYKNYNKEQVLLSLSMTLQIIKSGNCQYNNENINEIRMNLEKIIFGKSVQKIDSWEDYLNYFRNIDKKAVSKLFVNSKN